MITDHAVYRDLQRHWYQDRDGDGQNSQKKDPDQMGIAWTCQFEQAPKKHKAIGIRGIGQCR